MALIYKSHKIRVYHPDDLSGAYNESPSNNEFRVSFTPDDFGFLLIDLTAKTYRTIENLAITDKQENSLKGENGEYKVQVDFSLDGTEIKKITITELEFYMRLEYIGEVELSRDILGKIRNQYVIGAKKINGQIQAYIKDGYYAPIEVSMAYDKVRQKLDEIQFIEFMTNESGEMEITVSFFEDASSKIQVDIKNNGFDIKTLRKIVEGLYESQNKD